MDDKRSFAALGAVIVCGVWILAGCGRIPEPSVRNDTKPPAVKATLSGQTPITGPTAGASWTPSSVDSGWELLRRGMELRKINLQDAALQPVEELTILRIDSEWFSFDAAYDPQGKDLEEWQSDTGAEAVVNGGYFRREKELFLPDGLMVVGGKAIGESYGSYAGMLVFGRTGPELRWLQTKPYDPREPLTAALQSFPMLIKPGGQIGFPEESEDNIQARRTVVGQDRRGKMVFLVASLGYFTLRQLSVYLYNSDLDLDIAMNLDGGPSSGMLIDDPRKIIPAQTLLPIVVTVYPK
jgi:hypothetical protein